MENKRLKKQILLSLVPVLVLSLVILFTATPKSLVAGNYEENAGNLLQSGYTTEDQKSDVPSHESVYISILKFIVNCNPFQAEAQQ